MFFHLFWEIIVLFLILSETHKKYVIISLKLVEKYNKLKLTLELVIESSQCSESEYMDVWIIINLHLSSNSLEIAKYISSTNSGSDGKRTPNFELVLIWFWVWIEHRSGGKGKRKNTFNHFFLSFGIDSLSN